LSVTHVSGVFEGGGVRGIALAGAAAAAMERGVEFEEAVGTSAGGLVASLVAAGYDPEGLATAVCSVDWPGLLDPVWVTRIKGVGPHLALFFHRGLYKGKRLEKEWGRLLKAKGIRTFGDLPAGRLRVVTTDLSHQAGVVLPDDLPHYGIDPDTFPVARALRMSAAVPFMFKPVRLESPTVGEDVLFADGAMASNYPIEAASPGRPVLGFRLFQDAGTHPHIGVKGPFTLARTVVLSGIQARYGLPPAKYADETVIRVPVSADLDFDLSPTEAEEVFMRGKRAAGEQLDDLVGPVVAPAGDGAHCEPEERSRGRG